MLPDVDWMTAARAATPLRFRNSFTKASSYNGRRVSNVSWATSCSRQPWDRQHPLPTLTKPLKLNTACLTCTASDPNRRSTVSTASMTGAETSLSETPAASLVAMFSWVSRSLFEASRRQKRAGGSWMESCGEAHSCLQVCQGNV